MCQCLFSVLFRIAANENDRLPDHGSDNRSVSAVYEAGAWRRTAETAPFSEIEMTSADSVRSCSRL